MDNRLPYPRYNPDLLTECAIDQCFVTGYILYTRYLFRLTPCIDIQNPATSELYNFWTLLCLWTNAHNPFFRYRKGTNNYTDWLFTSGNCMP